jgi:hypothetical protein
MVLTTNAFPKKNVRVVAIQYVWKLKLQYIQYIDCEHTGIYAPSPQIELQYPFVCAVTVMCQTVIDLYCVE